jgi:hypothetical protein
VPPNSERRENRKTLPIYKSAMRQVLKLALQQRLRKEFRIVGFVDEKAARRGKREVHR